jgi:hypothetical protein
LAGTEGGATGTLTGSGDDCASETGDRVVPGPDLGELSVGGVVDAVHGAGAVKGYCAGTRLVIDCQLLKISEEHTEEDLGSGEGDQNMGVHMGRRRVEGGVCGCHCEVVWWGSFLVAPALCFCRDGV